MIYDLASEYNIQTAAGSRSYEVISMCFAQAQTRGVTEAGVTHLSLSSSAYPSLQEPWTRPSRPWLTAKYLW